jgi:hypothetical protein
VLKTGDWIEAALTVTNVGKTLGKDANIQIMGAVEAEGALAVGNLRGNGASVTIPVKIRFKEPGEVPIIVKATASRVLDGKEYSWESTSQFMVKAPETKTLETSAKFSRELAAEQCKCAICMGNVKPGMNVIKCSCGRTTHEPCGNRVGKCPGCGMLFAAPQQMSTEQVDRELFDGGAKPSATSTVPVPPDSISSSQPVHESTLEPAKTDSGAEPPTPTAEPPKRKRLALKLR